MSLSFAGAVHAADMPANTSFASADEASEYLVARLKHLADDVDLSDPEAVRAALDIPFRTEEHERIWPEDACSAPVWRDLRSLKAVTDIPAVSWYRTSPTAAGKLDVPQAF